MIHRTIFDDNTDLESLKHVKSVAFLSHLNTISKEYVFLQLAKLHDPAIIRGNKNLSLEYIVEYGGWDAVTLATLRKLHNELNRFANLIKPARHKMYAHFDLNSLIDNHVLGAFEIGDDVKYFNALQEFVNIVYDKAIGGPCPFSTYGEMDAQIFLEEFYCGANKSLESVPFGNMGGEK
jgi:hypothetical protein